MFVSCPQYTISAEIFMRGGTRLKLNVSTLSWMIRSFSGLLFCPFARLIIFIVLKNARRHYLLLRSCEHIQLQEVGNLYITSLQLPTHRKEVNVLQLVENTANDSPCLSSKKE